jgi:hypothetical protein
MNRRKWLKSVLGVVFLVFLPLGCLRAADPLDDWVRRNPLRPGNNLAAVTFGNNTFVAVGRAGVILTSIAGVDWTQQESLTDQDLLDIAYGDSTFVAVGSRGTILTSSDGVAWVVQSGGTQAALSGIAHGNGLFVTVGVEYIGSDTSPSFRSVTLTSTNGQSWSKGTFDLVSVQKVAYGNQGFLAVGPGVTLTSRDGFIWNRGGNPVPGPGVSGLAFGNGSFIAVRSESDFLYTFDSAIQWQTRLTYWSGGFHSLNAVTYANGRFVAVGSDVFTSPDGIRWSLTHQGTDCIVLRGVVFGNETYVAVGDGGGMVTSVDGVTWEERPNLGDVSNLVGIAFGGGRSVALGSTTTFLASSDGRQWPKEPPCPPLPSYFVCSHSFWNIVYANGNFVAVGLQSCNDFERIIPVGITTLSTNGSNWKISGGDPLQDLVYTNGIFVGVGGVRYCGLVYTANRSTIQTSTNGLQWTSIYGKEGEFLRGVTYANGTYVAVGYNGLTPCGTDSGTNGAVLTSSDGLNWISQNSGTTQNLLGIAYGTNIFVAVGMNGVVVTSTDGKEWTVRNSGTTRNLYAICFGGGSFVAVGDSILTSPDGTTWTERRHPPAVALRRVAFDGNNFIAVGLDGVILQPGQPPPRFRPEELKWLPNGTLRFVVEALGNTLLGIETSNDLLTWAPLINVRASNGVAEIIDGAASEFTRRFYRTKVTSP